MSQIKLENLFRRCDKKGTGFIDATDFRELCAGFDIDPVDADFIFTDLDHDGDGKISFEDFSFGFRDFLTPGIKRGSAQLSLDYGTSNGSPILHRQGSVRYSTTNGVDIMVNSVPDPETQKEIEEKQQNMEKKHDAAKDAWQHLTEKVGKDDVKKFLGSR